MSLKVYEKNDSKKKILKSK